MVRIKNRYLLINILYPDAPVSSKIAAVPDVVHFNQPASDLLTPQLLLQTVREAVHLLYGDYGSGSVGGSLSVRYLSTATSTAIIRVTRAQFRLVWAALTFITRLPKPISTACVLRVVRVSGTIRKAEEEAIRRAREAILRARRALEGTDLKLPVAAVYTSATLRIDISATETANDAEDEDMGTVVMRDVVSDCSDDSDDGD